MIPRSSTFSITVSEESPFIKSASEKPSMFETAGAPIGIVNCGPCAVADLLACLCTACNHLSFGGLL